MARMSEAEKQKSHGRILDAAARTLRAQGVETTSVSDVMKAAGMTHGGFYRHFASKEELVAAAIEHAADTILGPLEIEGDNAAREEAAIGYVSDYLSEFHRNNLADGCPLAALGCEVLRDEGPVRDAAQQAARRTVGVLSAPLETDRPADTNEDIGLATLSVLVGTIVLSRLFEDDRRSGKLLELGRETVEVLQDHHARKKA